MSKSANPRRLADNEAKATIRMLRVSPQKLNLLAQLIRGKKVSKALADLEFSNKRISHEVRKALESAIANAENNHELDVDDLVVEGSLCRQGHGDEAFQPARPRPGRADREAVLEHHDRGAASSREEAARRPEEETMGQKINPIGLRLGVNRTWDSRWFANKGEYGKLLHEDMKIRETLQNGLKQAAISKIVIERPHRKCRVNIYSARPGVVIGKKGADIDKLRKQVAKLTKSEVAINIVEVRKPEVDATLVAESIAQQLERRVAFRRAMKRAVQSAMRLGAEGIRINCSGRLGGAEIARLEWYREGRVPLHTLRADVDYGVATAHTAYGTCGIKVWIFKGEILEHDPMAQERRASEAEHSTSHRSRRERDDRPHRDRDRDHRGDRDHRNRRGPAPVAGAADTDGDHAS